MNHTYNVACKMTGLTLDTLMCGFHLLEERGATEVEMAAASIVLHQDGSGEEWLCVFVEIENPKTDEQIMTDFNAQIDAELAAADMAGSA